MATTRQEFIDLADELISGEFADFAVTSTIVKTTAWNDATQSQGTIESDEFGLIPIDSNKSTFEQQNIQIGDLVLIGERQKITRNGLVMVFGVGDSKVNYSGTILNIVDLREDPAGATIQIQARPQ